MRFETWNLKTNDYSQVKVGTGTWPAKKSNVRFCQGFTVLIPVDHPLLYYRQIR